MQKQNVRHYHVYWICQILCVAVFLLRCEILCAGEAVRLATPCFGFLCLADTALPQLLAVTPVCYPIAEFTVVNG